MVTVLYFPWLYKWLSDYFLSSKDQKHNVEFSRKEPDRPGRHSPGPKEVSLQVPEFHVRDAQIFIRILRRVWCFEDMQVEILHIPVVVSLVCLSLALYWTWPNSSWLKLIVKHRKNYKAGNTVPNMFSIYDIQEHFAIYDIQESIPFVSNTTISTCLKIINDHHIFLTVLILLLHLCASEMTEPGQE